MSAMRFSGRNIHETLDRLFQESDTSRHGESWTPEAIHGMTFRAYEKNGTWVKWICYRTDQEDDDEAPRGEGDSLAGAVLSYLTARAATET